MCRWLTLQESSQEQQGQAHGKGVIKYLGISTTRESNFPVFQSAVTLAETPNWRNQQLRSWVLNQISSALIPTDINIYLGVGAHEAHSLHNITAGVHDYHTLDSKNNIYLAPCNKQYLETPD